MLFSIRKKGLFFFVLMIGAQSLLAQHPQSSKQPIVPNPYPDVNFVVYKTAMALHDYATAIYALHYIIAATPTSASYADTLALLYAQTGQYLQAGLLADVQLNTRGYTNMRMEVRAVSNKNLQNPVAAIDSYNTLYEKTKNPVFGFEKLQLEYGIKRLAEASQTASKLLIALPVNDSTRWQMLKPDKTIQIVPLRAGILSLQGAAFIDLNQKTAAQQALQAALALSPDFEQAKNYLKAAQAMADKK